LISSSSFPPCRRRRGSKTRAAEHCWQRCQHQTQQCLQRFRLQTLSWPHYQQLWSRRSSAGTKSQDGGLPAALCFYSWARGPGRDQGPSEATESMMRWNR
jgi:hypothetical protein